MYGWLGKFVLDYNSHIYIRSLSGCTSYNFRNYSNYQEKEKQEVYIVENIFYVLIAYILFAIPTTLFVSQIGFLLSITALPVLVAITLIILEVISIFKK